MRGVLDTSVVISTTASTLPDEAAIKNLGDFEPFRQTVDVYQA